MTQWSGAVPDDFSGELRLDRYVAERLSLLSRSQLKSRSLSARVNGKAVKLSRRVMAGDLLEIEWDEPPSTELVPQDLPLRVLYEDERVIVVNKRQGMIVHPGAGNPDGTLANALLFRRQSKGLDSSGFRPGIVHRLDKDTSGVLIAAWDDAALEFLAAQFRERTTRKTYVALVCGSPPADRGRIETRIARDSRNRQRFAVTDHGGKKALTLYRVVARFDGYTLLRLALKTGRTHQLRVHLRHIGCPILGDPIYGRPDRRFPDATLMLHAWRLRIVLPGAVERSTFTAPLPRRFAMLRELAASARARGGRR